MRIRVCKTFEISESEWEKIVHGFSESFNRPSSVSRLKNFYSNNLFGFSYHAIALNNKNDVIGHTTIIPSNYNVFGVTKTIGLSSGTYIIKSYRHNVFILLKMNKYLCDICKNENIFAIIGVPNENIFQLTNKIFKRDLLGYLKYYIIPLRVANLTTRKLPLFLNYISLTSALIYIAFCQFYSHIGNKRIQPSSVSLDLSPEFKKLRFKNGYHSYRNNGITCHYKIDRNEMMDIAYLMDFSNEGVPDLKSLSNSLWHIAKTCRVDAIAYIGTLKIRPRFLVKIPYSMEPKHLPLTGEILSTEINIKCKRGFLNIDNWSFSLINFDVK